MLQSSISTWLSRSNNLSEPHIQPQSSPPEREKTADLNACAFEAPTKQISHTHCETQLGAARPGKLPNHVKIVPVTRKNVQAFRRLNSLLLPIPYQKNFYDEILDDPVTASITRVAQWQDLPSLCGKEALKPGDVESSGQSTRNEDVRVVAGIRGRLLHDEAKRLHSSPPYLYVSTLGTLAPFRGHGIAARLLQEVALNAAEHYGVQKVSAHVWEANEEALEWYKNRGFQVIKAEQDYYRRLAPKTAAWVVERVITTSDILRWQAELGLNTI